MRLHFLHNYDPHNHHGQSGGAKEDKAQPPEEPFGSFGLDDSHLGQGFRDGFENEEETEPRQKAAF